MLNVKEQATNTIKMSNFAALCAFLPFFRIYSLQLGSRHRGILGMLVFTKNETKTIMPSNFQITAKPPTKFPYKPELELNRATFAR